MIGAKEKTAEEVVRQYAQALNSLDVEPIIYLLYHDFKFVFWVGGRGHGIRTDIRYIGFLYKIFLEMKKEGRTIKSKFCYVEVDNVRYFSIQLLPPIDSRIIYPMYDASFPILTGEILLLCKVRNSLLCKVECYDTKKIFALKVNGKITDI